MSFLLLIFKNVAQRKTRSLLTATGIGLGVATVLGLVGFSSGLKRASLEIYDAHGIDAVVLRSGVTQSLTSNLQAELSERLMKLPGVKAVNPCLTDLVSFGDSRLIGVPIHGWPVGGFAASTLQLIAGRRLAAGDHHGILLGKTLARSLRKDVGDRVQIEGQRFDVIGIYEGANLFENSSAVVVLDRLQQLMDRPGQVTEFQLQLKKSPAGIGSSIQSLQREIARLRSVAGEPIGFTAIPTQEYVSGSTEVRLATALASAASAIALVVGSIGMLNTMIMSVLERTRDIGILRAIGWRSRAYCG